MKILTESLVENNLSMEACIPAMREAMIAVSERRVTLPIRQFMGVNDTGGKLALMPGAIASPDCFGIKLVCKYPREPDSPYGTHVGMVLIFDSELGIPLAMIEGASLTAIRTAAASAMATDILANPVCEHLAILGCGEQAERHILSMLAVRDPELITIWGRDKGKANAFAEKMAGRIGRDFAVAETVKDAVLDADLICTTTSSPGPILEGKWLKHGTHVNLVGAAIPTSAEADQDVVTRSHFFVDYTDAALAAAGELLRAIEAGVVGKSHIAAEIGQVANGTKPGRETSDDITVYKSLGVAAQDLAAAHALYQKALSNDLGIDINMMDYEHV